MSVIKLNPAPTFEAEFELRAPRSEQEVKVKFTFRALSNEEFRRLAIVLRLARSNFALRWYHMALMSWRHKKLIPTITDLLFGLVAGWEGIEEECTRENLAQLLNISINAPTRILAAYIAGRVEAHRKN